MPNAMLRLPIVAGPFADPTTDAAYVIARAPKGAGKYTIVGASAVLDGAVVSDASNWVSLRLAKTGVDGAATPVNVTGLLGGASSAWEAEKARDFVITDAGDANVLLPGEHVKMTYDENGTVAPGAITVFLELVPGVA